MITITHNLDELFKLDKAIASATGKSLDAVLADDARQISWITYDQIRALPPGSLSRARQLAGAAKARGFEMGRKGNALTPAQQGISARAWRGAKDMLGGEKSAWFKVSEADGLPIIRRARFGGRTEKLLKGNRWGNRFAPSAKSMGQLTPEAAKREMEAHPELKRLNLRALATANEIRLRGSAAKGSTIAVQFLPRFYRRSKSATTKNGPLVEHSQRTKIPLGRIDFLKHGENLVGVQWSAMVPGTAEVMEKHDIMSKVSAIRTAQQARYLESKMKERLIQAVIGIPAKKLR